MEFIVNKIERDKLCPGDHIYTYGASRFYSHHGIYVEEDTVIHFMPTEGNASNSRVSSSSSNQKSACHKCGYRPNSHRGVIKTCLDCFLEGYGLNLFKYNVSKLELAIMRAGTCSTAPSDPPSVVLDRAYQMLKTNGFGSYDLYTNNCESFAIYCKTGFRESYQVKLQWKNLFHITYPF